MATYLERKIRIPTSLRYKLNKKVEEINNTFHVKIRFPKLQSDKPQGFTRVVILYLDVKNVDNTCEKIRKLLGFKSLDLVAKEFEVSATKVELIIGKEKSMIYKLQSEYKVKIDVIERSNPNLKLVRLFGDDEGISLAIQEINRILAENGPEAIEPEEFP